MFLLLLAVFLISYTLFVVLLAAVGVKTAQDLRLMFSLGCVLMVYIAKYQV